MKTKPESVNAQNDTRTVRDDIRKNNPRLRSIHDPWVRRAMVVYGD